MLAVGEGFWRCRGYGAASRPGWGIGFCNYSRVVGNGGQTAVVSRTLASQTSRRQICKARGLLEIGRWSRPVGHWVKGRVKRRQRGPALADVLEKC